MGDRETIIRIGRLSDQGTETDSELATAAERLAAMWQPTLDARAFRGRPRC
jgi:hypothetical protein